MNRARAFAAVLFGIGAMLPTAVPAQNLEAGKSPGQLFSNTCSACHRSPRGLLRTVPPGSLPGFLREHYTTSRDMAQQLSGFLISNGATDTRGRPQEARQQPPGAEPPRPPRQGEPEQAARPRPGEAEQPRSPRPGEPEQAARPADGQAAPAVNDPRMLRREERRAKREADRKREAQEAAAAATTAASEREASRKDRNRRSRITPARIEAASERGKFALPLGDVVKVEPPPKPAVAEPAPEPDKPSAASAQPEPATRTDPVPQVTPAPPVSSTAEAPQGSAPPETSRSDDPPSGSTAPPAPEPQTAPPPGEKPPAPPISN